jgi:exodeoxyribonuclease VII small subunit
MKSFEERLERLEEISRLVNQECPLEEALALFEEGVNLSRSLEKELEKIERKVEILQNPGNATGGKQEMDLFADLEEEE